MRYEPTRRELIRTGAAGMAALLASRGSGASAGQRGPTSRPAGGAADAKSIDRVALLRRHDPHNRQMDPFSALSVGNGEFSFTADVTGLQTFTEPYEKQFPLCTAAQWAWHTTPPPDGVRVENFRYTNYDTAGRPVPYPTSSKGQEPLYNWMRENPHRLHLGRIGLALTRSDHSPATPQDLEKIDQTLDLWTALLSSRFEFQGQPVLVQTCCHPTLDLLAIRVHSPLLRSGMMRLFMQFPYGSPQRDMADWDSPQRHTTRIETLAGGTLIQRELDSDRYSVAIAGAQVKPTGKPHEVTFAPDGDVLELVCHFTPAPAPGTDTLPSVDQTQSQAAEHWQRFWTEGGAIDLAGSTHEKSAELERRIVLSQYNTAVHCAGSMPPQETGLLFNSWNGKSHLEMHWWQGVHFAAWNRLPLFQRSLDFYRRILPLARQTTGRQGYAGARWPKMVGRDGVESPSPVGPLLIWQQPHPIYYAELCYRAKADRQTLEQWREIVDASADFMASYALPDPSGRYCLGPPLKTVSEHTSALTAHNPTFELCYWRFGLRIAQQWRERLGQARRPEWDHVLRQLAEMPIENDLYLKEEGLSDTFTHWNWEHPAMLGIRGMLRGDNDDTDTLVYTLEKVMQVWQWDRCWGWDFPMVASCAAKLARPDIAIDALLIDSPKNQYHPNGHVYQRENLTAYLPANGALLGAAATMCLTSGFPRNGKWSARSEGLSLLL